jgi:tetratricopeptide (TPR) repeat protein
MYFKDYYQILGLKLSADTVRIRQQYKNLVKFYHPDLHPGERLTIATEKMLEVNEAYEVLSNVAKRASYDVEYKWRMGNKRGDSPEGNPVEIAFEECLRLTEKAEEIDPESKKAIPLRDQAILALEDFVNQWPDDPLSLQAQLTIVNLLDSVGEDYILLRRAARKVVRMTDDLDIQNHAAFGIAASYHKEGRQNKALVILEALMKRCRNDSDLYGDCLSFSVRVHLAKQENGRAWSALRQLKSEVLSYDPAKLEVVEEWVYSASASASTDYVGALQSV